MENKSVFPQQSFFVVILLLAICCSTLLEAQEQASPESPVSPVTEIRREKHGFHEIVKEASQSVVTVLTESGSGSGFVIRSNGYILTNEHVISKANTIEVQFSDMRSFRAQLVGSDKESDVALLKIAARELTTSKIGDSSALEPGETVIAIGSPKGFTHSVTSGIVSALGRSESIETTRKYRNYIQTDAAINSGNSGGPLLNSFGEVVGINTLKYVGLDQNAQGLSFSIPINQAMGLAEQLIETGKIRRGRIGVEVDLLTFRNRVGLRLPEGIHGVHVTKIEPDGPADIAGVLLDDVITRFNGDFVRSVGSLQASIGCQPPEKKVKIQVVRGNEFIDLEVILGSETDDEAEDTDTEATETAKADTASD